MKTVTLKITGMHCTSCAINIDFELEEIEGVNDATTSYVKQQTNISFDPQKTTLEKILHVFKTLKYTVEVVN